MIGEQLVTFYVKAEINASYQTDKTNIKDDYKFKTDEMKFNPFSVTTHWISGRGYDQYHLIETDYLNFNFYYEKTNETLALISYDLSFQSTDFKSNLYYK
ncbi:hypothetical protein RF11_12490 [Thelohanellus kitauei]|uniref:Uncharacterized protein n=1 Tax=Thelohanellus kitauei TaxID=669202 RepID=A0A0C2MAX4_THEKT|nr:hypothetical protein RF11_12490 [Thelohanellus kitauei]